MTHFVRSPLVLYWNTMGFNQLLDRVKDLGLVGVFSNLVLIGITDYFKAFNVEKH